MQKAPITAFKYVESHIKDRVLNGSIRLGSQDYFRTFSTKSTGDPNEGKSTHRIYDTFTAEDADVRFHNQPPNVSLIKLEGNAKVIVAGSQFSTSTNFLIFCATLVKNDNFWAHQYDPPKDSVLVINHFRELGLRIHSQLTRQFQIRRADICKVEYRNEERLSKTEFEGACPCRKRRKFKDEKEIRAFFEIIGEVPEYLDITIDPKDILEEWESSPS